MLLSLILSNALAEPTNTDAEIVIDQASMLNSTSQSGNPLQTIEYCVSKQRGQFRSQTQNRQWWIDLHPIRV